MWYKNMDKLIKYVNGADVGLNLIYSTPSCYLKAKNDELDDLEEVVDDFFPYADGPHMFWEWLSIKNKYFEIKEENRFRG
jgi:lysosomal alpha-mannosidase